MGHLLFFSDSRDCKHGANKREIGFWWPGVCSLPLSSAAWTTDWVTEFTDSSESSAMLTTAHASYWQETLSEHALRYPSLEQDLEFDVAIIGGGITGLTAAAELKRAGRRVAVLEGAEIGSGTSGFTSGHLDATTDLPLARMIADLGEDRAATLAAALRQAIDQIEARCRRYRDCEFRRVSSYQFTQSVTGLDFLREQCAAARKLGYASWFTRNVPLPMPVIGAVETAGQGRLHVLRYLQQLAAEVDGDGSAVFENTTALPPEAGLPCIVETLGGKVTAQTVFVATHSPFLGISQFDFRVFPYQSYVIAARVRDDVADALYWDDADPYHYIRLASPSEPGLVLIGGADHKTGHAEDERDRFDELERYALDRFSVSQFEQRWSGQYFIPADGLPHIGRAPGMDGVFLATGYAGTGLTWGTVAGSLVAKLIRGERHPLEEILNPGRLTLIASATQVITENLDVVRRFIADRIAGGEPLDEAELAPGCGKIMSHHGRQVAAYRDPAGHLFRFSPVCSHAGCIVHWNDAEHTWDCPCHGGRFTADGRRFAGPPPKDLAPDQG
jgi:glycine/D-amino acid oxidase-like deaminating enzyme/nitrite reductase/ring-hydroxylating ferredoxin subunit